MNVTIIPKIVLLAAAIVCLFVASGVNADANSTSAELRESDRDIFSTDLPKMPVKDLNSAGFPDNHFMPVISAQRDITVWATGLPNKGRQKRMYRLDRGVRYKVRVSRFTHFGTWKPTRRALKNDACFEFNARSRKVSLPVIKTNFGFNFCSGNYKANHVYLSQAIYGNGSYLVMWVYDSDYRDNYGDYYVEVIELASRR